ncbi:MAG: LysR family transcriptional regulator [Pseudomonadota bacterium]
MQDLIWQDLRFALALSRAGSRTAAARVLRVDETTVARRIAALEAALGSALFLKGARGRAVATALGTVVLAHAARIDAEVRAISGAVEATALIADVRVTAVPVLINRFLVPQLRPLLEQHPGLTVDLIPEARNLDLTKREADLAIRLAKPETGGSHVLTRRLGPMRFAAYKPAGGAEELPWIGYEDASRRLPQAQWQNANDAVAGLRVADLDTALEAVAAGHGRAFLPSAIGDADARLERTEDGREDHSRDIWMLAHADQRHLPGICALTDWLSTLHWSGPIAAARKEIQGSPP